MLKSTTKKPPAAELESLMPIVKDLPPNFSLIKQALPLASNQHTYCYDGKIFNPSGHELSVDRQYHEMVHMDQQEAFGGAEKWWYEYLMNPEFRLQQELEAYGKQYAFAKERIVNADSGAREQKKRLAAGMNNLLTMIKEELAKALSGPEYGNLITYSEAESKIRKYGKKAV